MQASIFSALLPDLLPSVFATLYDQNILWPTTLGVVSEQCPKGGALTLNAIAGIGMLAVGILRPHGKMTEDSIKVSKEATAETYENFQRQHLFGDYTVVDAGSW